MQQAMYRIIDANFNRAREALRVMEDFCRFYLNDPALSGSAKELRHRLCGAIAGLDNSSLVACRDTQNDVGTDIQVPGQLKRQNLDDMFIAASKRLPEALRTISEAAAGISPAISGEIEKIRYQSYTLEKDILARSNAVAKFAGVRLYVILTCDLPVDIIRITRACAQGGADCIQLRTKMLADEEAFNIACEVAAICRQHNVVSIINDRVDLALASGADGVHLGQGDLPIAAARKLANRPFIFGATTHNTHELEMAIADGADYVGVGPAFASATKPTLTPGGPAYLKEAVKILAATAIPAVAIGGITLENLPQVLSLGIKAVAVGNAIINAKSPEDACKAFKKALITA